MHLIIDLGKEKTSSLFYLLIEYFFSWILYMTLQSLGSYPLSIENDTSLHVNFARQLENLGFWQFAIFILLHINESTKYRN
jgi:nuclear pore complex protein Nup98-Nup96